MKFLNHTSDTIFNDFKQKFSSKIDALWPEIKDLQIDVYDDISPDPRFLFKDCVFSTDDFKDTPFSALAGYQLSSDIMYDIIKCDDVCKMLKLDDNAKLALIAHEVGHYIEFARTHVIKPADLREEIFCDDCAVKLGLRDGIKSAIQSMIDNLSSNQKILNEWNTRLLAL